MTENTGARAVTRRGAPAVLASVVLAVAMMLAGASRSSVGRADAATSAGVHRSAAIIDRGSRSSVQAAYRTTLVPALAVAPTWSGAVNGCVAGAASAATRDATLQAVNYFRAMAGLAAVTFDPELSATAQEAALMMSAKQALSHAPDPTWPCYSTVGAEGAKNSNLYLGRSGASAIAGYMVDPGAGNAVAGHRRWILYPPQTQMGSGSTADTNALYVFAAPGQRPSAPTWVSWPPAGFVPVQIEPGGRWSLSANDEVTSFAAATVTVTAAGSPRPVTVNTVVDGYGDNTLVWQVDTGYAVGQADGTFHVSVSGIVRNGVTIPYEYDVTLFDATSGASPAPPPAPPAATGPTTTVEPPAPEPAPAPAPTAPSPAAPPGGPAAGARPIGALAPARLLDTRAGEPTVDGQATGTGALGARHMLTIPVTGRGGVPVGATAVVLNLTATGATADTYLTVYPTGSERPTASNLNIGPGQTVANLITAAIGPDGTVTIYNNNGNVQLMVDVQAWYPAAAVGALRPGRLADTRAGQPTVDDQGAGQGPIGPGRAMSVAIAGRAGVPVGATAVALNLTATNATANTYLTVYPTGTPRPTASNVNLGPGETVANLVTAAVGADGTVTIYNNNGAADVVVDVQAWYPAGTVRSMQPARLLDTRAGQPTVDGRSTGGGALAGGRTITLPVAGRSGVGASATAVVLNLTATGATADTYLTVYPTGSARPTASNVNPGRGQTVANLVTATVGPDGTVTIYNNAGATDVVVDVQAWFAG